MTVAMLAASLFLLSGCETTAQKSARLEREAHRHVLTRQQGLVVTHQNPDVKVLSAIALHDENGVAAVVRLRNESAKTLRDAPIAIALTDSHGTQLYRNDTPGLDATLVSVPLLAPHRETVWVDDQIQAAAAPRAVSARVGVSAPVTGAAPRLSVTGVHTVAEAGSGLTAVGSVSNRSAVTQQRLVVVAVARRAGRIVAAGRAVLPEVPAGASTPFQVFFIGKPQGAKLEVSAPPSTLG